MRAHNQKKFGITTVMLHLVLWSLMASTISVVHASPIFGLESLGNIDTKLPEIKLPEIKLPEIKPPTITLPDLNTLHLKAADYLLLKNVEPGKLIDWVQQKVNIVTKGLGIDHLLKSLNEDIMQILQDRLPGTPGVPLQQPEVLEVIKYMAEYAAASYCENPSSVAQAQLSSANAQAAQALTCLEDYCPTLTKNGVTTHFTFEGKHTYDTTGIVTLDRKRNLIVLSFRGSKSLRNFFTDARIALTPTEGICTAIGTVSQECKAHTGFLKASLVELDGISAALDALYAQHPTFKVVTVGHSLGGAIAILTAAMLRERGKYGSIDIYTYGSPRVGNDALNRHISRTEKGRVYRTTFMDDPIPRLPPVGLGYSHVEPEYHVWRGVVEAGRMGRVEVADVKVFGGTVNRLGNMSGTKGPLGFDVMAHGRYFAGSSGWVSGCGRGLIEF